MPIRARTNEQKSFRREQILAAAHTLLTESGYDGFAMAPLARRANVAKGTLYLYFTTREEVLLALCTRYVDQWIEALRPELRAGMTEGDYAEHFFATAYGVENLMCLIARLEQTIEHNVAIDRFIETKRTFQQQIELIAVPMSTALAIDVETSFSLLQSLVVLLVGTAVTDQGPNVAEEALPEDVRNLVNQFSARPLFVNTARHIIAGVRADALSQSGVNA
jgi:AcrR family transcriptional regulator